MPGLLEKYKQIPIGFGGGAISGEGGGYGLGLISENEAISLLQYSFEKGLRIFDTAPIYGFGTSEQRMGKALKNIREKVFIISKCGVTWHSNGRVNMTNDPQVAQQMLEESLRRLQSEYIDLYMIHWPDPRVDIRRPLEVLARAKEQGKIKHLGLSNTNIEDLNKASEVGLIEVVQAELSFLNRQVAQGEMFDHLSERQISFISWGTLDKGILTGRAQKGRSYDSCDSRSWAPWWKKSNLEEKFIKSQKLIDFAHLHGYSGLELALGHNFSYPQVSVVLCGARDRVQIDSLLRARHHLPDKELIRQALELIKDGQQ